MIGSRDKKHITFSAVRTAALCGLNYIVNVLVNHHCSALFLYISKALDSVNHNSFLKKNKNKILFGLHDCVSNRTQLIVSNGIRSIALKVSAVVPQGSVLGPLLFSLSCSSKM